MSSPEIYTLGDFMKKLNEQPGESWSRSVAVRDSKNKIVVYCDEPESSGEYSPEEFKEKFGTVSTDTKCMVVVKNESGGLSNMFSRRTPTFEEYIERESKMEFKCVTLGGDDEVEVGTTLDGDDEVEVGTTFDELSLYEIEDGSSDFGEEEIDLVMEQVSASKEEVISSLEKHNGDMVSAIMELS